jgi:quercetin dioxygenase-like cupin family protein
MKEKPLLNSPEAIRIALPSETTFAPKGIVSRTLFATSSARVTLFAFDDGQELTDHSTPRHALVHVLSGECDFKVWGKNYDLKTGELLSLPPGASHSVRARGRFSMLLTLSEAEPLAS